MAVSTLGCAYLTDVRRCHAVCCGAAVSPLRSRRKSSFKLQTPALLLVAAMVTKTTTCLRLESFGIPWVVLSTDMQAALRPPPGAAEECA